MNVQRRQWGRRICLLALSLLLAVGCVYYNTFFNAKKKFKLAEKQSEGVGKTRGGSTRFGAGYRTYEEAIEHFGKIIERHPDSKWVDDAYYYIGVSYYRMGEFTKAQRAFREILDNHQKSSYFEETSFWMAVCRVKTNEVLAGRNLLQRLSTTAKNKQWRAEAWAQLGDLFFSEGEYDSAAHAYLTVAEEYSSEKIADAVRFKAGEALTLAGNEEEALKQFYLTLRETSSEEVIYKTRVRMADAYFGHEQFDSGLVLLEELARSDLYFDSLGVLDLKIGWGLEQAAQYEDAIDKFKGVTETFPKTIWAAEAFYRIGYIYQRQYFDLPAASEFFKKAKDEFSRGDIARRAMDLSLTLAKIEGYRREIAEYLIGIADSAGLADSSARHPDSVAVDDSAAVLDAPATEDQAVMVENSASIQVEELVVSGDSTKAEADSIEQVAGTRDGSGDSVTVEINDTAGSATAPEMTAVDPTNDSGRVSGGDSLYLADLDNDSVSGDDSIHFADLDNDSVSGGDSLHLADFSNDSGMVSGGDSLYLADFSNDSVSGGDSLYLADLGNDSVSGGDSLHLADFSNDSVSGGDSLYLADFSNDSGMVSGGDSLYLTDSSAVDRVASARPIILAIDTAVSIETTLVADILPFVASPVFDSSRAFDLLAALDTTELENALAALVPQSEDVEPPETVVVIDTTFTFDTTFAAPQLVVGGDTTSGAATVVDEVFKEFDTTLVFDTTFVVDTTWWTDTNFVLLPTGGPESLPVGDSSVITDSSAITALNAVADSITGDRQVAEADSMRTADSSGAIAPNAAADSIPVDRQVAEADSMGTVDSSGAIVPNAVADSIPVDRQVADADSMGTVDSPVMADSLVAVDSSTVAHGDSLAQEGRDPSPGEVQSSAGEFAANDGMWFAIDTIPILDTTLIVDTTLNIVLTRQARAAKQAEEARQRGIDKIATIFYTLAEAFYDVLDEPDSALYYYQALVDHFPESEHVPRALFAAGHILESSFADSMAAKEMYGLVLRDFGRTDYAGAAIGRLGLAGTVADSGYPEAIYRQAERLFLEAEQPESALVLFQTVAREFPTSIYVPQATYAAVMVTEKLSPGGDSSLYQIYQAIIDSFPRTPFAIAAKERIGGESKARPRRERAVLTQETDDRELDSALAALKAEQADTTVITLPLAPRPKLFGQFIYPESEMGDAPWRGTVVFKIFIDYIGEIAEMEIISSSDSEDIDLNARLAVEGTFFDPDSISPESLNMWYKYEVAVIPKFQERDNIFNDDQFNPR